MCPHWALHHHLRLSWDDLHLGILWEHLKMKCTWDVLPPTKEFLRLLCSTSWTSWLLPSAAEVTASRWCCPFWSHWRENYHTTVKYYYICNIMSSFLSVDSFLPARWTVKRKGGDRWGWSPPLFHRNSCAVLSRKVYSMQNVWWNSLAGLSPASPSGERMEHETAAWNKDLSSGQQDWAGKKLWGKAGKCADSAPTSCQQDQDDVKARSSRNLQRGWSSWRWLGQCFYKAELDRKSETLMLVFPGESAVGRHLIPHTFPHIHWRQRHKHFVT